MDIPGRYFVNNEEETADLAAKFASVIKAGDVVSVNGKLGSGKTFFIKKVLLRFGISTANSPSFAIVNEFKGKFRFYHFDFYRIIKYQELLDIGVNDYFGDTEAISFIEWGNLFPEVLPKSKIEVNISVDDENKREFKFKKY